MNPNWIETLLAYLYRLSCRPPGSEQLVEIQPGVTVRQFVVEWSRSGPHEARTFLDRVPGGMELQGMSVLTVGRGAGDLAVEAARRGGRRVVAIDMATDRLELTRARLSQEPGARPVELSPYNGTLSQLGDERFDVVLAADAFRRYGADRLSQHVERLAIEIAERLKDGGVLAVEFGSPWKGPYGGATDSRFPWIHLLMPESIIFDEFRRVRPSNRARTFDDIGINRITVARVRTAMDAAGLRCEHLRPNVGQRRLLSLLRTARRLVPPMREYLTHNVYGVWRRPPRPPGL